MEITSKEDKTHSDRDNNSERLEHGDIKGSFPLDAPSLNVATYYTPENRLLSAELET